MCLHYIDTKHIQEANLKYINETRAYILIHIKIKQLPKSAAAKDEDHLYCYNFVDCWCLQ